MDVKKTAYEIIFTSRQSLLLYCEKFFPNTADAKSSLTLESIKEKPYMEEQPSQSDLRQETEAKPVLAEGMNHDSSISDMEAGESRDIYHLFIRDIGRCRRLNDDEELTTARAMYKSYQRIVANLIKVPRVINHIIADFDSARQEQRSMKTFFKLDKFDDEGSFAPSNTDEVPGVNVSSGDYSEVVSKMENVRMHAKNLTQSIDRHGIKHPLVDRQRCRLSKSASRIRLQPTYAFELLRLVLDDWARQLSSLDEKKLASENVEQAMAQLEHEFGLSSEQCLRLFDALRKAENRWVVQRNRMVESHLRLVIYMAKRFKYSGLEFSELIQEGNLGLLKSTERFDYRLGFKFSTYAMYWIRLAMSRAIVRQGKTVRIPFRSHSRYAEIMHANYDFESLYGRSATITELAAATGLKPQTINETLVLSQPMVYGDETISDDHNSHARFDIIEQNTFPDPADVIGQKHMVQLIQQALENLNEREAFILIRRFELDGGEEHTLQQLASLLNVTRERIRQIQQKALLKIKQKYELTLADLVETYEY